MLFFVLQTPVIYSPAKKKKYTLFQPDSMRLSLFFVLLLLVACAVSAASNSTCFCSPDRAGVEKAKQAIFDLIISRMPDCQGRSDECVLILNKYISVLRVILPPVRTL